MFSEVKLSFRSILGAEKTEKETTVCILSLQCLLCQKNGIISIQMKSRVEPLDVLVYL